MEATNYISNFNNLRNNFIFVGNLFTEDELKIALKDIDLSSNIIPYLKKNQVILLKQGGKGRKGKAKYSFTNIDRPTHKDLLQRVLDDYSDYRSKTNKKYKMGKKIEKKKKTISEEEAIQLLKSLGYKIYKQVVNYEEI